MTNTELLQKRFATIIKARANGASKSLKEWEIFIQDCIEDALTEDMKASSPCWWQHTDIDIFMELMGVKSSQDLNNLIDKIAISLHE